MSQEHGLAHAAHGAPFPAPSAVLALPTLPTLPEGGQQLVVDTLDLRPLWHSVKDGFAFCTFCRVFATDGHLASEKHKNREQWYRNWGTQDLVPLAARDGPPAAWGNPSHFEWREGWWWCLLCNQWADPCHVQGKRHQKRTQWPEWYGTEALDDARSEASAATEALDSGTSTAASSSGGRSAEPDPWGPAWDRVRAAPTEPEPSPWRSTWSQEHGRCYRYNIDTGERTWQGAAAGAFELQRAAVQERVPAAPEAMPVANAGPVWQRLRSEEHKCDYFWNETTCESLWMLPEMEARDPEHPMDFV